MKFYFLLPALFITGTAVQSVAATQIGDPAPPLAIKEWIRGQPVDVTDGKNIYVIEFWATWCPPCLQSIPHLTALNKKFKAKGVVIIGVSDEKAEIVKPFVTKMGDQMDYIVACDNNSKTSEGYRKAFGEDGIPHAFVVGKKGTILWHGHPLDNLEKVLDEILSGKYDIEAFKKQEVERRLMVTYQQLASTDEAKAKAIGQQLLAAAGQDIDALCRLALTIVADASVPRRDFSLAEEALDKAEKAAGGKDHRVLGIRAVSRFESGKPEEAITLVKEAIALSKTDQDKERYQGFLRVMEARNLKKP
jgi:thiol-disulfide isomerase/thioredoxin